MQYNTAKEHLARLFDDNPKLTKKVLRMKKSWDEVAKLLQADKKQKKKTK